LRFFVYFSSQQKSTFVVLYESGHSSSKDCPLRWPVVPTFVANKNLLSYHLRKRPPITLCHPERREANAEQSEGPMHSGRRINQARLRITRLCMGSEDAKTRLSDNRPATNSRTTNGQRRTTNHFFVPCVPIPGVPIPGVPIPGVPIQRSTQSFTVFHQSCEFCGFSTQWPSSGK